MKTVDKKVDLIHEMIFFSEHIDQVCYGMDSEELWNIALTRSRLAALIEAVPEEDRNAIVYSSDYMSKVRISMRDWFDGTSPVEGWPENLLARLAPDSRPDVGFD